MLRLKNAKWNFTSFNAQINTFNFAYDLTRIEYLNLKSHNFFFFGHIHNYTEYNQQ